MSASKSLSRRRLASTDLELTLLGLGAAPIGNLYQPLKENIACGAIIAASNLGIRYLDTAPHYGFGLSESRLGSAFPHHIRKQWVLSSKVGRLLTPSDSDEPVRHGFVDAPPLMPVFDYSYDGVMRSVEASLERLNTDQIDIVYVHDLGAVTHGDEHSYYFRQFVGGGYRALEQLKRNGHIKAIGIGVNEWQVAAQLLQEVKLECILLAGRYTLLEQEGADKFFPLCEKEQVSVIIGGAFNSGILACGINPSGPNYYNYAAAPAWVVDKVSHIEAVCHQFGVPLGAAALQFPAAHPQVCSVLAGCASASEVEQAIAWMDSPIENEFWICLKEQGLLSTAVPTPTQ